MGASFEAIVLAGGLGTRLASRLEGIPKAMAPVSGRPFLEILLNRLKRGGCSRVLLSVGHLRSTIQDHFGASFHGLRIDYVIEDAPLGTGGAIRKALSQAAEESVVVLNGDTFLEVEYADILKFHASERASATIAVRWQDDVSRYGGVVVEGTRIMGFEEKGHSGSGWINAGAYVLRCDLEWPPNLAERFSFEVDFLAPEIGRLAPAAYKAGGVFIDIGVPEDLDRAQRELAGL